MKKMYIAPEMDVMELATEALMLSISGGKNGPSWGGESEGGMDADANERRGSWGDLWR